MPKRPEMSAIYTAQRDNTWYINVHKNTVK
jgi:hypothetical protein